MSEPTAPPEPDEGRVVLDARDISRALTRIAHEILEHNKGPEDLILLGLQTRDDGARFLTCLLALRDFGLGHAASGQRGMGSLRVGSFLRSDGKIGGDLGRAAIEVGAALAHPLDQRHYLAQRPLCGPHSILGG